MQDVYLGVPLGLTPVKEREGSRMCGGRSSAVMQTQTQLQPTSKNSGASKAFRVVPSWTEMARTLYQFFD